MRKLSEPTYGEYTDAEAEQIAEMEAASDAEAGERRSSMRWNASQFETIKAAADAMGMPYQTYVKDAAFRRALEDLQRIATLRRSA
jgi:predicted DNA binding CopG/RHH family protein